MMNMLVILPTYNECENLAQLCSEVLKHTTSVHILIIDDNSPDGTGQIADKLAIKHSGRIFVVHRVGKLGLGSAIMTGFQYAIENGYEFVVNMDADLSHNPQELPGLITAAKEADLVIASRHLPGGGVVGWPKWRRFLHWLAGKYTRLILGSYVSDYTNSFKVYRVEMLQKLPLNHLVKTSGGFVWHTLIIHTAHKMGFRIKEIPSVFTNRRTGKSKMSPKEMIGGLWAVLKCRLS